MQIRAVGPRGKGARGTPALALLLGGAVAYLLDPDVGRKRRARVVAVARRSVHRLEHRGRIAGLRSVGRLKGGVHRLRWQPDLFLDDVTLAHKVESVLFRDPQMPKGAINMNAEHGVVFLRGQVESPDLVERIDGAVRRIPGVHGVINLLHLPGTPAPHAVAGHRA